ncbi:MAG: tetratricopeptide repeat protein [Kiritimatiellae bacterium]|nr:tetratricopeptide repeat protein [Kiritimatiellia bacterium]
MSDDQKPHDAPAAGMPPAFLPEEMYPLYDWYRRHGSNALTMLSIAVLLAAGTIFYLRHRQDRGLEASAALTAAESVESLETLAGQYGRTEVAPVIRIRLAKAYYDAGKYAEAQSAYDEFLHRHADHDLADIARLGRGAAMEAQQSFAEAQKVYSDFAQANPDHYLYPSAVMGEARCLAAQKKRQEALDLLDRLIVARADTPWESLAQDLRSVIERFEGFSSRTLFDQLGAAARKLDTQGAATNAPAAGVPSATVSNR